MLKAAVCFQGLFRAKVTLLVVFDRNRAPLVRCLLASTLESYFRTPVLGALALDVVLRISSR